MKSVMAKRVVLALCMQLFSMAVAADTLKVVLDFDRPTVDQLDTGFSRIMVDGCKLSNQDGLPMLPQKVVRYALPPDADPASVSVVINDTEYFNFNVAVPVQPGTPMVPAFKASAPVVATPKAAAYGMDDFVPAVPVVVSGFPQLRDWRMVELLIQPVAYNAAQGQARALKHVEFSVNYKQAAKRRTTATDPVMSSQALDMIENAPDAAAWYKVSRKTATTAGEVYVILTTDAIYNQTPTLFGFTTHKQSRGYQVHVVTETKVDGASTAIGWNEVTGQAPNDKADRLRKWLQNNYQSLGIKYVLLVGNPNPATGDLPMKLCWPRYDQPSYRDYPTDYYFADLSGNWDLNGNQIYAEYNADLGTGGVDFTAEVLVGRFPVYSSANLSNLQSIVAKTIAYENAADTSWRRRALLPVAFLDPNTDEANIAEDMKEDYLTANGFTAYTLYEQGSVNTNFNSIFTSNEELLNNATVNHWKNNSYGLTLWMGHGWYGGAVIYSGGTLFSYDQCPQLNNNRPSIVYMGSCSCGEPEYENNTSYQMLVNGGIAGLGASRVSWYAGLWDPDIHTHMDIAGIGYTLYKYLVTQNKTFGDALYTTMVTMNGGAETGWWENRMDFNLYGDPSLSLSAHMDDADNDGLPDGWETSYGFNPSNAVDATLDLDADTLSNLTEYQRGTHPRQADTDLDGLRDDTDTEPLVAAYQRIYIDSVPLGYVARDSHPLYDNFFWLTGCARWQDDEYIYQGTLYDDRGMLQFNLASLPAQAVIRGANLLYTAPATSNTNVPPTSKLVHLADLDPTTSPGAEAIFLAVESNTAFQVTLAGNFPWRTGNEEALWLNAAALDLLQSRRAAGNWKVGVGYTAASAVEARLNTARLAISYTVPLSDYPRVAVAGSFNGWNPAASNMQLVADYTWQCEVALTNATGVQFKFAANNGWVVNWGDNSQADRDVPIQDWADQGGANIAVNGTLNGFYRITFQERTREYSVVRLPDPDTDSDGMPDVWETANSLNPNNPADAGQDPDGDGYTNLQEYQNGTNPQVSDQPAYDSSYASMTLAGTFNGWNPALNNMRLVADYIWELDVRMTNASGTRFKFVANASWTINWGDQNQTATYVPVVGTAEQGAADILADGTLNGLYRFRFNEQSREYSVNYVQDPDTDADGMPDHWEILHGLNKDNPADASQDPDMDGFTNLQEYQNGTDPHIFNQVTYDSNYAAMTLAGSFNSWNPALSNMSLVADYTWRADVLLSNASGVQFKFAANGGWGVNWGDNSQVDRDLPIQDTADQAGANIAPNGTWNGTYRFTFQEVTRQYTIERLPDADTDADGMPDAWENAHGLNPNNSGDAAQDADGDGTTNLQEYQNGTDPQIPNWNSNYSSMTVAGTFQGWNPAANNMQRVGHYTWGADITLNNATGVRFKFAANGSWTMNWGEWDQSDFDLPLSGLVEQNNNDILVNGTMSGTYRFRYNEQTREYSVALLNAATDDLDADGMADAWEQAYGLNSSRQDDAAQDLDGDGLGNKAEFALGGDPTVADTDDDGQTDWEEYLAGTTLTDRNSFFGLMGGVIGGQTVLQWQGKAGCEYTIYRLDHLLASGTWFPVASGIAGETGLMSLPVNGQGAGMGIFRLELKNQAPDIAN